MLGEELEIDEERDPARLTIALGGVARSLHEFFTLEDKRWGHGRWGAEIVDPAKRTALLDELDLVGAIVLQIRAIVEGVAAHALTREEIREVEREFGIVRTAPA